MACPRVKGDELFSQETTSTQSILSLNQTSSGDFPPHVLITIRKEAKHLFFPLRLQIHHILKKPFPLIISMTRH
jgi:hypothetical protein